MTQVRAEREFLDPPRRPKNWWDSYNPEHLRAELADVDAELRKAGIEYPLGARGVNDLRNFYENYRRWTEEVAASAQRPGYTGWDNGDYDLLAEQIDVELAERLRLARRVPTLEEVAIAATENTTYLREGLIEALGIPDDEDYDGDAGLLLRLRERLNTPPG